MFAETSPEASSCFSNVKNGRASVTGYVVRKIIGLAEEVVTDGKIAFRTEYLGERTDQY